MTVNKKNAYMASLVFFLFLAGCLSAFKVINRTNPDFLKEVGVDSAFNPHKGENCHVCHLASSEVLRVENPSKKQALERRSMRTDLLRLCDDCHNATSWKHHPAGVPTTLNKNNLPLDSKGRINCATTCHNVHGSDKGFRRGMLRDKFDDLCLSCHDY